MTEFDHFAESLTPEEENAIRRWLGMHYDSLRWYQIDGTISDDGARETAEAFLGTFASALQKAVICRQPIYRGLSAGSWRPERVAYLRALVGTTGVWTEEPYSSATTDKEIAHAFCFIRQEDEKRDLSVLLTIRPTTARYLAPFAHDFLDENEVVLLAGSRYRITRCVRLPDPRSGQELWEVDLDEVE